MQGDFNARTNVINDTIVRDKFDTIFMGNDSGDIPNRNSADKVPDGHRGKEVLELCKSLELVILNGKKLVTYLENLLLYSLFNKIFSLEDLLIILPSPPCIVQGKSIAIPSLRRVFGNFTAQQFLGPQNTDYFFLVYKPM